MKIWKIFYMGRKKKISRDCSKQVREKTWLILMLWVQLKSPAGTGRGAFLPGFLSQAANIF